MRRRDIPKILLASAAGADPSVRADTKARSATDFQNALQSRGDVRIAAGTYQVTGKLQTLLPNNIVGDSRHDTILQPTGFADYVLEVGNGKPGPNAGRIERLRFYGARGNLGCLHMNNLSHMWRLEDLLFSGGPCPALVVENCWDSNYTNIDILAHVTRGSDPAKTAAVIFRKSDNIYCRGLRIEGAHSGGIYTDGSPIYVVTGKIDDGFGGPQTAAAITVAPRGHLVLDDFYLGGMRDQFIIDTAGTLKLGRVILDGGTNKPAAIYDHRAWTHVDAATFPTFSGPSAGPEIPILDLGGAQFRRTHPSVQTETPAAVYSKIHPIRQVKNLRTIANGPVSGNTILIGTSLRAAHNDVCRNSFLVHNSAGVRRKILKSYVGGNLLLEGTQAVKIDGDWSIEYCENHHTPIRHEGAWLAPGQTLFAVVSSNISIAGPVTYVAAPSGAAYGTTKFKITGSVVAPGRDVAGLFLINNVTREPYYIEYGIDDRGFIGIIYDRRSTLRVADQFSIVAGYTGDEAASRPHLVQLTATSSGVVPDLSRGSEFEITATDTAPFAISDPINAHAFPGERITVTLCNAARGELREVVWGSAYRLATWVSPAPGHCRSIDFRYNGRNWIEVSRTPTDVPC